MNTVWLDTLLLRALLLEELRTSTCLAWKWEIYLVLNLKASPVIGCSTPQQQSATEVRTCIWDTFKDFFDLPENQSTSQPRWKCLHYQGSTAVCSVFTASCAQASVYMGEIPLIHACNTFSVLWASLFNAVLFSPKPAWYNRDALLLRRGTTWWVQWKKTCYSSCTSLQGGVNRQPGRQADWFVASPAKIVHNIRDEMAEFVVL